MKNKKLKLFLSIVVPLVLVVGTYLYFTLPSSTKSAQTKDMVDDLTDVLNGPQNDYSALSTMDYMIPNKAFDFDHNGEASVAPLYNYLNKGHNKKIFVDQLLNNQQKFYHLSADHFHHTRFVFYPAYKIFFTPATLTILTNVPRFSYRLGTGDGNRYYTTKHAKKITYRGKTAYQKKIQVYPAEGSIGLYVKDPVSDSKQIQYLVMDRNRTAYFSFDDSLD